MTRHPASPHPRRLATAAFALLAAAAAAPRGADAQGLTVGATNSPYAVSSNQTFRGVVVGGTDTGTLNQTGGSLTDTDVFILGDAAGGNGTYNLSAGSLGTGSSYTYVGNNGTGSFNQTGGSVTTNGASFYLGVNAGSSGTYTMGGGFLDAGTTTVGEGGLGTVNQTGGSFTTRGSLFLGENTTGFGAYNLGGTGFLSVAGGIQIGAAGGAGAITQGGSSRVSANSVRVGAYYDSTGSYSLNGGTLTTRSINGAASTAPNAGSTTFNFNGGTIVATGDSGPGGQFISALSRANVRDGGAVIDSAGHAITVPQILLHSNVAGDRAVDGGLEARKLTAKAAGGLGAEAG